MSDHTVQRLATNVRSRAAGLVTVVIPTWNRRDLIGEAVESVLSQDWPSIELLVIDDGSTDGTSDYLRRRYGGRICVVEQRNAGPSVARNAGFAISSGEFLTSLDSDDLVTPGSIRVRAQALSDNPEAGAVYGVCLRQKERGGWSHETDLDASTREAWPADDLVGRYARRPFFHHTTLMFRSRLLPADGELYNPELRSMEDYLMVLSVFAKAHCLPCHAVVARIRRVASRKRLRFAHQQVIDQGLAPVERFLRESPDAARLQPFAHIIRARFLMRMATAAWHLGEKSAYRQYARQAKMEYGLVARPYTYWRRWILSYLPGCTRRRAQSLG